MFFIARKNLHVHEISTALSKLSKGSFASQSSTSSGDVRYIALKLSDRSVPVRNDLETNHK